MATLPRSCSVPLLVAAWLATTSPAAAPAYVARRVGDIVQLEDTHHQTRVSVVPGIGNIAFEMNVKGHNVLYWPYESIDEFTTRPSFGGIPFLAPWANRLDEAAFYANGRRYGFDMTLGNIHGDLPIHGFVQTTTQWHVVETTATNDHALLRSRLEFFRQPAWIKQWPFAHIIEMTYVLQDGNLEVRTGIANLSAEPMPVAIGFHPYFQLTDSSRDEWTISVGARTRWLLTANKVPTGETQPIEALFPNPIAIALQPHNLDDVFADLIRDEQGRATMSVIGKSQRLEVVFGSKFRSTVIWAPSGRNFICFEPMAAITNGLNLAHKGLYKDLQHVPPAGTWQESFWMRPTGF